MQPLFLFSIPHKVFCCPVVFFFFIKLLMLGTWAYDQPMGSVLLIVIMAAGAVRFDYLPLLGISKRRDGS
jgi:hypothetical protein